MTASPFVALALAVAMTAGAERVRPGFTADADVVILSGLPGDVETEKAYQDQLDRLLGLLRLPECRPRRLFVLTDSPESVRLPGDLAGKSTAATREELAAVVRTLADAAGPRVVFAWGHGGHQRTTPVFHVRGPRITASDLAALAPARGPASFVLFFRGSGRFARLLRGADQQILASEDEVAFRSDPVGFPILLGLLHEQPSLAFDAAAARLGAATSSWYDEHHLVRQEEPTLFLGEKTRRLATSVPPAGLAGEPASARAASDDAWARIVPAAPGRHPDADAVVLQSLTSVVLGDNPAIGVETDVFIEILTEEGKRHGDLELLFSPPEESLTLDDIEVRRPDGRIERVPAETSLESAPPSVEGYALPRRRALALPGIEPGSMVRLHVHRTWKRFPLPHAFLELPLVDDLPVEHARVEVRVPERSAFHFALRHLPAQEPERAQTRHGRLFEWRFEDLSPPPREPLAPPDRTPALLVSTFPDWAEFASWYRGLIREADRVTPEIAARATELTAGARTDREKVVALYDEITRMRYVAIPLGVNSHRPHGAANVLRNRYGDCKDKANLFNTMLASLGIEADLVLVPRFTQADEAVPGLAFNHAISRVRLGDEIVWADTTDDVSRFGLLPPGDPGRKVLVVDGSTELTLLPVPRPEEHWLRLTTRLSPDPDGRGTFVGALEAESGGYADYALRLAARAAEAPGTEGAVLARSFRPVAGLLALRKQTHTRIEALDEPFRWSAEATVHGVATPVPGSGRVLVRGAFWLPREWDEALHARRGPLFLNQGYPLTLSQRVEISLPSRTGGVVVPEARGHEGLPLAWGVRWAAEEGNLTGRLDVQLGSGELSADETIEFQRELAALLAALAIAPAYDEGPTGDGR